MMRETTIPTGQPILHIDNTAAVQMAKTPDLPAGKTLARREGKGEKGPNNDSHHWQSHTAEVSSECAAFIIHIPLLSWPFILLRHTQKKMNRCAIPLPARDSANRQNQGVAHTNHGTKSRHIHKAAKEHPVPKAQTKHPDQPTPAPTGSPRVRGSVVPPRTDNDARPT